MAALLQAPVALNMKEVVFEGLSDAKSLLPATNLGNKGYCEIKKGGGKKKRKRSRQLSVTEACVVCMIFNGRTG